MSIAEQREHLFRMIETCYLLANRNRMMLSVVHAMQCHNMCCLHANQCAVIAHIELFLKLVLSLLAGAAQKRRATPTEPMLHVSTDNHWDLHQHFQVMSNSMLQNKTADEGSLASSDDGPHSYITRRPPSSFAFDSLEVQSYALLKQVGYQWYYHPQ